MLHRYQLWALSRQLRPLGLRPGQYPLLFTVCNEPGIHQDALAETLFLNKSSVTRGVLQLERCGFLTRSADPADKRALRLTATAKGMQARGKILNHYDIVNAHMTEGFNEDERAQLYALLLRACENVMFERQSNTHHVFMQALNKKEE